jgi:hypothetical protein
MDDVTTTEKAPPTEPASSGARKAFSDMGRSLGLMAVVIAGLLLLGPARTLVFPHDAEWQGSNFTGAMSSFERASGVTPQRPEGLPDTWRVNTASARHKPQYDQVHVGWAVPGSAFAGLDELAGRWRTPLAELIGDEGMEVRGTTEIAGRSWDVRSSGRGETVYTAAVGELLVVVTGDATDTQLRLLAASLG